MNAQEGWSPMANKYIPATHDPMMALIAEVNGRANKPPAFQFYVQEWLGSKTVRMMTPAQRGIYIDLLAFCWDDEDLSLPADREKLGRLVGAPATEIPDEVLACFSLHPLKPGHITNIKLVEVRYNQLLRALSGEKGGRQSGKQRASKDPSKDEAKSNPPRSLRSPSPLRASDSQDSQDSQLPDAPADAEAKASLEGVDGLITLFADAFKKVYGEDYLRSFGPDRKWAKAMIRLFNSNTEAVVSERLARAVERHRTDPKFSPFPTAAYLFSGKVWNRYAAPSKPSKPVSRAMTPAEVEASLRD